jgi:hypothetical protein
MEVIDLPMQNLAGHYHPEPFFNNSMRDGHIIAICAHTPDPRFQDLLMLVGFSAVAGGGVPFFALALGGVNQMMAGAVNDG